jgi:hypothetical protein
MSGSTVPETLQRDLCRTWKGYIRKPASSGVLKRKNTWDLDSATEKVTQSDVPVQASFLDMPLSTTSGRILRNQTELRCVGTTTPV